jgi:hypothetical protein
MGRYANYDVNENHIDQEFLKPRKRASYDHPSANALRERIRAQNLKKAYIELQKTLPNVPPDTKLPRLNILLLAIDHIEHLMSVLSQETATGSERLPRKEDMIQPFIKVSKELVSSLTCRTMIV